MDTTSPGGTIAADPVLHAAAEAIVPGYVRLGAEGRAAFEAIIDRALGDRPEGVRRQFRLFLRVLDLAPLPRYGRRFRSLDVSRRTSVLEVLQDSPLLLLRRGTWGVRTMVLMGYYGRPEAAGEIGYAAHPRGRTARGGSA